MKSKMLLEIAQTYMYHDQSSTAKFVPGLWRPAAALSLCWQHQRPRRHHRLSGQVKTELCSQSWTATCTCTCTMYFKHVWTVQQAYCRATLGWQDVKSLRSKLDFVEEVYQKLTWLPLFSPLSGIRIICEPAVIEWLRLSSLGFVWDSCWHFVAARITYM